MLEKFFLWSIIDVVDLNIWISSILNKGVKNQKMDSSVFELPFSSSTSNYVLNSTLLKELELVLVMFTVIEVPTNFVYFGHLEHLKLCGINFVIDPSSNCLTLSLPVLKKFDISNCD